MALLGLRRKKGAATGLDLAPDGLRIVQLDRTTTPFTVVSCLSVPWPNGERVIPGVTDPSAVGSLIARMLDDKGMKLNKVCCALASPSVFTKRIKTPILEWQALKEHVELEALAIIPPSVGGVQIDFHVLRRLEREQFEVLLVAAKQDAIASINEIIESADLKLSVLDVDSLASENAVEMALPELCGQTVATVNIGERFSTILVTTRGIFAYSGDVPVGMATTVDLITDGAGIGPEEAYSLLFDESQSDGVAWESAQLAVERICTDLGRRLSLFWTLAEVDNPIERIVLCGEGAGILGLREMLMEKTGVPVVVLDPLSQFSRGSDCIIDRHPSHYTVATGLALRSADDRITELSGDK